MQVEEHAGSFPEWDFYAVDQYPSVNNTSLALGPVGVVPQQGDMDPERCKNSRVRAERTGDREFIARDHGETSRQKRFCALRAEPVLALLLSKGCNSPLVGG